jgi:2-keto-3-deoxy-L-rhamnonate aldolase RhmA
VKERSLILIYRDWTALKAFRDTHGLYRAIPARVDRLQTDLMGRMAFDFMLVDTELAPHWEDELNRRQCVHVVPVVRLRYRIVEAIANTVERVLDRIIAAFCVDRCRRVRVVR